MVRNGCSFLLVLNKSSKKNGEQMCIYLGELKRDKRQNMILEREHSDALVIQISFTFRITCR